MTCDNESLVVDIFEGRLTSTLMGATLAMPWQRLKQLTNPPWCDILLMQTQEQCGSGSVVEHLLAKEKVAGSIPVSRSISYLE